MSDIFDDVEKMVAAERNSEDTATSEQSASDSQSFNDSELEDIMAEIESLESDFSETEIESELKSPEVLAFDSSKANKTDLQKQIEDEINNEIVESASAFQETEEPAAFTDEELAEIEDSTDEVAMETNTVLPFETKKSTSNKPKSEMSFEATGSMNVVLKFKVGSETAELFIDQDHGLIVNMNGVELCLSEDAGCTVTMENGINFNIPLTSSQSSSKKKSA